MEIGLVIAVALLAVVVLVLVLSRARSPGLDPTRLDERLESLNRNFGEVTSQATTYQETMTSVNQALGGLTKTSEQILEVGRDMQKLQDVFAAPTLRGGVGEMMLEQLLRQMLPSASYDTQHTFTNGHRVDAVIRLGGGLVPIDAKFPLENFRRVMEAEDDKRRRHMTSFRRDVRSHVDAIADNYIRPGETLDFALMYVPAENVYYEIVLKKEGQDDILDYAWSKRVFPTSPNSLYTYLHAIALGLRGLQVEENAKQMIDSLRRLNGEFERFAKDYKVIGTHLRNAHSKYGEGLPKLESIQRELPGRLTTGTANEALDAADSTEPESTEALA